MKKNLVLVLILAVSSILMNCYYDNEEALYGIEQCSTDTVTFATVSTIIKNNCVSCHSQSLQSGGVALDSYAGIKAQADNGNLVGVVSHASGFSPMPKNMPQLSQCNVDAIRKWVENGALNN